MYDNYQLHSQTIDSKCCYEPRVVYSHIDVEVDVADDEGDGDVSGDVDVTCDVEKHPGVVIGLSEGEVVSCDWSTVIYVVLLIIVEEPGETAGSGVVVSSVPCGEWLVVAAGVVEGVDDPGEESDRPCCL